MTSSQSIDALILGGAGYGGGELLRLLHAHPDVDSVRAVSGSHAGQPWHAAHPRLRGFVKGNFEAEPDWQALAKSPRPVLFSSQPNGILAKAWPAIEQKLNAHGLADRLTVIDLSGDFRLTDPLAYEVAYGEPHPASEYLQGWVYGLSEHAGDTLLGARRIANPGCFATAIQLALRPLLATAQPEWVAVTGVTGSSGSGARPSARTHHPERAGDFRAYRPLSHQHEAEVRQALTELGGKELGIGFVPHSAPMTRGIFVTVQAHLPEETAAGLPAAFEQTYADTAFVRLCEAPPAVTNVLGTNACDIALTVNGSQVVVMAALDNLIKGMAGQAVQNMNLALGQPERAGLYGF